MADTFLQISRFLFGSLLIVAGLFLLSFLISSTEAGSAHAKSKTSATKIMDTGSPNVVTNGVANTVNGLAGAMNSAGHAFSSGVQAAASTTAQIGKTVASGAQTGAIAIGRGAGNSFAFAGSMAGQSIAVTGKAALSVAVIPGDVVELAADKSVSAFIRPSDHIEVPIIDPNSAELQTAIAALPPAKSPSQATPQSSPGPQWPMHGRVTTEFGVDHWPFQHTHTGIDISNGHGAEVKPFRPGKVVETVHSNSGLGNHVIVDHGNGVTSVYAHLASISANKGQDVGPGTTLGLEGTTGVSTGNHLHFEVRVHGQAADPRKFIGGQP